MGILIVITLVAIMILSGLGEFIHERRLDLRSLCVMDYIVLLYVLVITVGIVGFVGYSWYWVLFIQ